jgi:hypothetical protein
VSHDVCRGRGHVNIVSKFRRTDAAQEAFLLVRDLLMVDRARSVNPSRISPVAGGTTVRRKDPVSILVSLVLHSSGFRSVQVAALGLVEAVVGPSQIPSDDDAQTLKAEDGQPSGGSNPSASAPSL